MSPRVEQTYAPPIIASKKHIKSDYNVTNKGTTYTMPITVKQQTHKE